VILTLRWHHAVPLRCRARKVPLQSGDPTLEGEDLLVARDAPDLLFQSTEPWHASLQVAHSTFEFPEVLGTRCEALELAVQVLDPAFLVLEALLVVGHRALHCRCWTGLGFPTIMSI
jgi:hypothetical protein